MLQRVALSMQHTAAHCNTAPMLRIMCQVCCNILQCVTICCSVLQCVTINMLQCVAVQHNTLQHTATHYTTLHHTAPHCTTLQPTAAHCNILRHTATPWVRQDHLDDLAKISPLRGCGNRYGVATTYRLLKIIGLFCRILSLL